MKRIPLGRVKRLGSHLASSAGKDDFPQLYLFFADPHLQTEKGEEEREPGSIWIGVRHGQLHCVLKEPSQGLVLRVEVPSLMMLLSTLEAALGAETSMWEQDTYAPAGGKRGRKKGS